jgi:hypothetical protein
MPDDGESSSDSEDAVDPNLLEADGAAAEPESDDGSGDEVDVEGNPVPPRASSEPEVRITACGCTPDHCFTCVQLLHCHHRKGANFQVCACGCCKSSATYVPRSFSNSLVRVTHLELSCRNPGGPSTCPDCDGPFRKVRSDFWYYSNRRKAREDEAADWTEYAEAPDTVAKNLSGLGRRFPAHELEPEESRLSESELETFWAGCKTQGFAVGQ